MKKRFFNTAVAIAAAMSLSVCAFAEAADPGISLPGFSGLPGASDATVGAAVGKTTVKLGSDEGVLVTGPASAFKPATYVYLGVSLSTSVEGETEAYVKECVETALKNHKPTLEDDKMTVNSAVRLKLYNQDKKEIQPNSALTVKIAYDGESNIVAYIDEKGDVEWIKLDTTSKIMTFKTSHFSDFYFLKLREGIVETLTNSESSGTVPGEVTTTPSGSTNPPGGGSTSSDNTTTTQAPEADTTTTQAPAVTTPATTTAPSGSDDKPNNDDNTTSGGNTTNTTAIEDNGNSNVGNDGAGNGADKNQATGVVLAVIPAAIAAAAVVISKKRK